MSESVGLLYWKGNALTEGGRHTEVSAEQSFAPEILPMIHASVATARKDLAYRYPSYGLATPGLRQLLTDFHDGKQPEWAFEGFDLPVVNAAVEEGIAFQHGLQQLHGKLMWERGIVDRNWQGELVGNMTVPQRQVRTALQSLHMFQRQLLGGRDVMHGDISSDQHMAPYFSALETAVNGGNMSFLRDGGVRMPEFEGIRQGANDLIIVSPGFYFINGVEGLLAVEGARHDVVPLILDNPPQSLAELASPRSYVNQRIGR